MYLNYSAPPNSPAVRPVPLEPENPPPPPVADYDLKLIAIVILADLGIIGSSFAFAYLAAGSHVLRALLGAALLGILESMRIPVALKLGAGKIASKARVGLAVIILAGGMLATTINAVPIINGLWSSRLEAVRKNEAKLAAAEADKAAFDDKKQAAKDTAKGALDAYKDAEQTQRTASDNLTALPAAHCSRSSKKARERCRDDSRIKGANGALAAAAAIVADKGTELHDANTAANADGQKTDAAFEAAKASVREAREASMLHLVYASATGTEVSSITDKQLAPLLQIAVFVPALLLGVLTTCVSLLAVSPVKPTSHGHAPPRHAAGRTEPEAPTRGAQETVPVSAAVEIADEAVLHFLAPQPENLAPKPKRPTPKAARPRGRPRRLGQGPENASRKGNGNAH